MKIQLYTVLLDGKKVRYTGGDPAIKYARLLKNKFPDSIVEIKHGKHKYEVVKGKRVKWRVLQIY